MVTYILKKDIVRWAPKLQKFCNYLSIDNVQNNMRDDMKSSCDILRVDVTTKIDNIQNNFDMKINKINEDITTM